MIQLQDKRLHAQLAQGGLGRRAVGTVALAEHHDGVLVNDALGLGFGGHAGWSCSAGETPEEGTDEGGYFEGCEGV